jgi:hypothetical protein
LDWTFKTPVNHESWFSGALESVEGFVYHRVLQSGRGSFLRHLKWVCVVVVLLTALAGSGAAMAADPAPPDDSGLIDQYREDVPTAAGPSTPGGGGNSTTPLPGNVRSNLYQQAGTDAKTLEKISTSSHYGAPAVTHAPDAGLSAGSSSGALSAAVSAVSDGSDGRLVALFIALVVVAATMLGAAAAKRGRRAT